MLGDVAVVFEAILVGIGEVGAVRVAEHVVWWAAAAVRAVRVARTLGRVVDVLLVGLILASSGAA